METRLHAQSKAALTSSFTPVRGGVLQRKCAYVGSPGFSGESESGDGQRLSLQRSTQDSQPESRNSGGVPLSVQEVLNSPGQPLDPETRAFMGTRFGHDFSQITVHPRTGAAAQMASEGTPQTGEIAGLSDLSSEGEQEEEPKEEQQPDGCKSSVLAFSARKGSVKLEAKGKEFVLRAGIEPQTPGVVYLAGVKLDPDDCVTLEYVQNIKSHRVVTFKDSSKLELISDQLLDTVDPYPTHVSTRKGYKLVGMQDSPGQGTTDAFGLIDSLAVKDSFTLFLRAKGKEKSEIIGFANWGWEANASTTNPKDDSAPLKVDSGVIEAPDGTSNTVEEPKLSPNIRDQKFTVVGGSDSYASLLAHLFNNRRYATLSSPPPPAMPHGFAVTPSRSFETGGANDAAEREADTAAEHVLSGKPGIVSIQPQTSFKLARQEDETTPSSDQAGTPTSTEASEASTKQGQLPCKPTFKSLEAVTACNIGMRVGDRGCELSLGTSADAGMKFHSQVESPEGCHGTLEYVQLVDFRRERRDKDNQNGCMQGTGALDRKDPKATLFTGPGTDNFESADNPGSLVGDDVYHSADDQFKLWLLWRPRILGAPVDAPELPRVALATVTWDWKAKTTRTGKSGDCQADWTISDDYARGGTGKATSENDIPTYSQNVAERGFSNGPC